MHSGAVASHLLERPRPLITAQLLILIVRGGSVAESEVDIALLGQVSLLFGIWFGSCHLGRRRTEEGREQ